MFRPSMMALVASLALPVAAHGQLMIPDVTNFRVMLFDETDGSLLNEPFIDMSELGGNPVNAVRVADQVWVSNQTNRTIHGFDLAGTYLGDVTGELDYVRGFDVVGDRVYAANVGQNTGHPERTGVAVIDIATASVEGFFSTGSDGEGYGFDVLAFGSNGSTELLVPDQSSTDEGLDDGEDIDRFGTDGAFLGTFQDSDGVTGIDNPMQLTRTEQGSVLAAGFTGELFGIFEYDGVGAEIGFFFTPSTNVYGVSPLGNGNVLFTTFDGVFVLDPEGAAGANVEPVVTERWAGFIEPLDITETACPADCDANGVVDLADLLMVLGQWGPCEATCVGDMDEDGAVGFGDLLMVMQYWGDCP